MMTFLGYLLFSVPEQSTGHCDFSLIFDIDEGSEAASILPEFKQCKRLLDWLCFFHFPPRRHAEQGNHVLQEHCICAVGPINNLQCTGILFSCQHQ